VTDVDVGSVAASSGLVGVPCFRRRRCSINGTAWGEVDSGRVTDIEPTVEKMDCETAALDVQVMMTEDDCKDSTATHALNNTTKTVKETAILLSAQIFYI